MVEISLQVADAPPLILASSSATRAAMIEAAGLHISQRPPLIDEAEVKTSCQAAGASAIDAAITLAELKAGRIAADAPPLSLVIGADQILTMAGRWFDKPQDRAEARDHLAALAGEMHELHTAVVAFRNGARIWHKAVTAKLWMRPCSDEFLDSYLDVIGDTALVSVGGYQIEGVGAQLFERIEGDRFAILGLPLLDLLAFLRDQGALRR